LHIGFFFLKNRFGIILFIIMENSTPSFHAALEGLLQAHSFEVQSNFSFSFSFLLYF